MQRAIPKSRRRSEILISLAVLALLLAYTYGLFFVVPYPGFYFNPTDGTILDIYDDLNSGSTVSLQEDDVIEQVGSTPFDNYLKSSTVNLFDKLKRGDVIDLIVRRGEEHLSVSWIYPGFTKTGFLSRFFNIWWLAYIFWFVGMATQLFIRPKDKRWLLFLASSYLTGLFIMFGAISAFHMWWGPALQRCVAWLTMPIYLHFHWIFPHSLRRIPRWLQISFYVVCCVMAVGELFLLMPKRLYFLAVILAFGGSILLLILHFIFQPSHRREVSFLAGAAFTALFPVMLVSFIGSVGQTPQIGPLTLLVLPVLPGAYFYVLYRSNLGILEIRTNRAISLNLFLILLGTALMIAVGYLASLVISIEELLFITVVIALLTALIGALMFPGFQALVERRILGIKLPSQSLSENYSARIITSDTLPGLLKLLREEVFPSLLIRQYVFIRNLATSAQVLLSENVTQEQIRDAALMELLASASTGSLLQPSKLGQPFDWVHLMLPLRFGSTLIGVWLLGRRDPDDHYPQAELPILQALANQTAVALSNIIQTERIKTMYEANIHRYEQERLRLAHDLHDSVLNEMAAILMKNDAPALSPEFQESYSGLIGRVREIVSDLRPPMLVYGLKFALDGLADNLSERSHDTVQIISEIQTDGEWRYPEIVESNIYRIVQEACENASKYARAKSISISGELSPERINIKVTDDGLGFNTAVSLKLDDMLANKHFGLAGMRERADLIGAEIAFDSKPQQGTKIHVVWMVKDSI
jgi:signal transduction histidine kinase